MRQSFIMALFPEGPCFLMAPVLGWPLFGMVSIPGVPFSEPHFGMAPILDVSILLIDASDQFTLYLHLVLI